jgi:hypothetical protein
MIHYLGTCIAVGISLGWVVEQGEGEHKRIIGLRVTDILARDKFAVILRRVRKVLCDSVVHYRVQSLRCPGKLRQKTSTHLTISTFEY